MRKGRVKEEKMNRTEKVKERNTESAKEGRF